MIDIYVQINDPLFICHTYLILITCWSFRVYVELRVCYMYKIQSGLSFHATKNTIFYTMAIYFVQCLRMWAIK